MSVGERTTTDLSNLIRTIFVVALLVGAGVLLKVYLDGRDQGEVENDEFNALVVSLRENRNRLQVYHIAGTVRTNANTIGGWGKILRGEMTVKQPWSANYYVNMADLSLDDYIWDQPTRTLIVRAPLVKPDPPNIDESKQVVAYDGPFITRDMQTKLRKDIATGAKGQATEEAAKPENMASATRAARVAIKKNLEQPLQAAGLKNVSVVVRMPADGNPVAGERWDVSRSIAEVLSGRANQ